MYYPYLLIPIVFSCFEVFQAVPVLEFGEKPTGNGELDVVNLELPTSNFSICFQLYMMQRVDIVVFSAFYTDNRVFGIKIISKGLDYMLSLLILKKNYNIPIEIEELGLHQWTKGCFTVNETSYELFMKGVSIGSGEREDVYKDTIHTNSKTLKVSKMYFSKYVRHKITNLKVWNIVMSRAEMERLTKQCNMTRYPTENITFSLDTTESNLAQLSAAWIEEVPEKDLCQMSELHFFRNITSTFDEAINTCETLGSQMYLPQIANDFEHIPFDTSGYKFWVPIFKDNANWIDYYTHENISNNIPWHIGEPNGGRLEPCVFVVKKRMRDGPCSALNALRSFICHFTSITTFKLRGLNSENLQIDTEYAIDHRRTFNDHLVFRGLLYGHWMLYGVGDVDSWFITKLKDFPEKDETIAESDIIARYYLSETSDFLPIGKKEWAVLKTFKTLKFTQVRMQKLLVFLKVTFSYLTISVWQEPIHMFKWPLH